ncbi:MAG: hypothetical protein MR030_07725 [Bacteroidales bacterium]|nr:hypothetical protein [Bacteroidales bacterium]
MKINKIIITVAILIGSVFCSAAQDAMSPYSRYGYGTLIDNATSAQRAMGGVGYAMQSGRQINVMNPASYASIDSLTFLFDMGLTMTNHWASDNGEKVKDFGGGLDYITLQVPITKYLGASAGLLPYSSTGYSFGNNIDNGANSYQGSGGINQLYAGVGVKPFKGFSLGVNFSYLFGKTRNDNYVYTDAGATTLFERVMDVRDYNVQFGLQYFLPLGKTRSITVGAVYSPGKDFRGNTYGIKYDTTNDSEPDTIGQMDLKGNYSRPATWGAGINMQVNRRLMVEADFTYQQWSKAKFNAIDGFEGTQFDDRWKVAAGLQYVQNQRGSWFRRIQYRLGGYYTRDYIKFGDNNVKEYGVSLGFGLPAPASKTLINLGLQYSHRQATPNPLVKEDCLYITIGVNFNELWFWRNKIK